MDREKKIAGIRKSAEEARKTKGSWVDGQDYADDVEFLLNELEHLEREYAEERAAHNAHVAELSQLEEEMRKLREERDAYYNNARYTEAAFHEVTSLRSQLQSAHQEIERLREHVSRAWKACWKVAGDDTKLEQKLIECLQWYADTQNYKYPTVGGAGAKRPIDYDRGERARDILREIGVTVE